LRQLQRVWPPLTVGLLGLAVVLFTSAVRSRHKGDTALRASGIDVLRATHETVAETVAAFTVGTLQLVGDEHAYSVRHGDHG